MVHDVLGFSRPFGALENGGMPTGGAGPAAVCRDKPPVHSPVKPEPRRGGSIAGKEVLSPRWGSWDSTAPSAGGSRRRLLTVGPAGLGHRTEEGSRHSH